jgi:hypothetical protein
MHPRLAAPRLAAAVLALFLALAPAAAPAQVAVFARAGAWEAFGGTTDDGKRLCGISTSGEGSWLGVKYFKGDNGFTIQLSSTDWTVKDGEQVKVVMRFDRLSPWAGAATGFHMSDGDAALELEVPADKLALWLREFRQSNTLLVEFPEAPDVEDWKVDLAGTTAITDRMIACMDRL